MPELPEVEVIRRDLVPRIEGRRIRSAKIAEPRLTRRRGTPQDVEAAVVGQVVKDLRRRGKCFIFDLGRDSLIVRLGMTGQLLWFESGEAFRSDRYTHAHLVFTGGGILSYRDIRKFGEMFILPTQAVERMLRVGVEPLGEAFTAERLREFCRSPSRIKSLLLDQGKVAGIGNIYADEALFQAGIRPTRRAASLRPDEIGSLRRAIRMVLRAGIRHRGSSIANYRDACGEPGRYAALHRVYHRHGEACRVCGTPIRRIVLGQRGTHFCPTCQR